MFNLSGKTALITGAGRGVGRGIALALARAGAKVIVNDLDEERAKETVALINKEAMETWNRNNPSTPKDKQDIQKIEANYIPLPFDVTDYEAVESALSSAAFNPNSTSPNSTGSNSPSDDFQVDILINNAGIINNMTMAQFKDTTPDDWRPYIELNLFGVMNCSKAALPNMLKRNFGRIITISSGAGFTGMPLGFSTYGAGKGGAAAFMKHLAIETATQGITANTVALGLMTSAFEGNSSQDTNGTSDSGASPGIEALAKTIPVGRLGTPADVGALCVYLASEEASWLTGQVIHLNGGSLT